MSKKKELLRPDDAMLALLAENRIAAMAQIIGIDLPLHNAITSNCSDEVVLALLAANGGAAVKESANGELPIHLAFKNGYSDLVVMSIFISYPCAAMIRCKVTGMLPLHLAATSSASPLLVEALIREYPEALEIVANGATPRDLVTAALPSESIRMLCRPSFYRMSSISTQASLPLNVPTVEAGHSGRDFSVAGLVRLSEVESAKAQANPKYNRTETKDWVSHLSEEDSVETQVRPKYQIIEPPDDRVAQLSKVQSVKPRVGLKRNSMEPEDRKPPENRIAKLSKVQSVKSHGNNKEPEDRVVKLSHTYHDHSKDSPWFRKRTGRSAGGVIQLFPSLLHEVLENVEVYGHASVISWQPHGRGFKIHKEAEFVEKVMPLYFPQTMLSSFYRQLYLYSFLKHSTGPDKGAYYHEMFLRGKSFLADGMVRQRVKGVTVKLAANLEVEPDFYTMPFVDGSASSCADQSPRPALSNNEEA